MTEEKKIVPSFILTSGPSEGLKIRGSQIYLMGIIFPPLIEMGLTDLPKSLGAMAPPVPPWTKPHKANVQFLSIKRLFSPCLEPYLVLKSVHTCSEEVRPLCSLP